MLVCGTATGLGQVWIRCGLSSPLLRTPWHLQAGRDFEPPPPAGTLPGSTTDANVYLDLYGESGQLQDLILRDTGDLFNAGQEDTFFFPNPGLGAIGSAVISHDDSGESG